jgi:L-fuculose-phosphate aldolase
MSDERYIGVKFRTVFLGRETPSDPRVADLVRWCRQLHDLGLSPSYGAGSAGNLSFRTSRGFVITRTASFFERITGDDFVEVINLDLDRKRVEVIGAWEPSSETQMHHALYGSRPDSHAVLHAHSDEILKNAEFLGLPITAREAPYGTPELAEQAVDIARKFDFLVLRNHGFIALGGTIDEAGQRVLEILRKMKPL